MESRKLAALLSSLISELLLLLFLLFPSSTPLSLPPNSRFNSNSYGNIFPLITHFLFSHQVSTSLSLLSLSRKRKRTHFSELDQEPSGGDKDEVPGDHNDGVKLGLTRNPDSFRNCFKMNSSTFEWLAGLLEPLLECRDPIGSAINLSPELRLGIGLFRLATGSEYPKISEQFGVSECVARFCSKQLCRVLCTNFRFWVTFPGPNELQYVSSAFEDLTGLPYCCGVIGCTRFKIVRNDNSDEHSIAAQIVVDSSSRILSIVAGFRDDKGDSRVLMNSTMFKDIERGQLLDSPPILINGVAVNQYLIGNGAYPLLPWLMIPFNNTVSGSNEENFNEMHRKMCVSVVRTIVSLRNWGVLGKSIHGEFKTAVGYIGACSILHNALLMRDDYSSLSDELGSYSLHDHRSWDSRGIDLEDDLIEKASVIRGMLATRAKEFGN